MMAKKKSTSTGGFAAQQRRLAAQFSDLDMSDPSVWPGLPRAMLYMLTAALVVGGLWFAWLDGYQTELEQEQAKEVALRTDFQQKTAKAVNLDVLKRQREQIQQYVFQLEKQLPGKAEMAALLSDVNQAGLGRSLQFELFRPGDVVVRDYYAELPIAVRVTGRYHDVGAFASDVAHLSRIVTLNNIAITPNKDNASLVMDATVRTFRYLDSDEIAAQAAAAVAKKAKK